MLKEVTLTSVPSVSAFNQWALSWQQGLAGAEEAALVGAGFSQQALARFWQQLDEAATGGLAAQQRLGCPQNDILRPFC